MQSFKDSVQAALLNTEIPGASYAIYHRGQIYSDCMGFARKAIDGKPAQELTSGHYFDLASLTKPLVTALLCALLVERKWIDLEDAQFSGFLVKDLLAHRTGLPAWLPFYTDVRNLKSLSDRKLLLKKRLHEAYDRGLNPRVCPDKPIYSDLNFLGLGFYLEQLLDAPLDASFFSWVTRPLGLEDELFFRPFSDPSLLVGATDDRFVSTELCPYRGLLQGFVHDDNAYSIGGVAGHAGLFGRASGVLRLACEFLPRWRGILSAQTKEQFTRKLPSKHPGVDWPRTLGFDTVSVTEPSTLPKEGYSPLTFGHLGFTGTSLWIDPLQDLVVVLLTNRVHPLRTQNVEGIRNFRIQFHSAVIRDLILA